MTGPASARACPQCGVEHQSALSLCPQCGAPCAVPLAATVLRPVGFGGSAPGPSPLAPAPLPPAAPLPVATARSATSSPLGAAPLRAAAAGSWLAPAGSPGTSSAVARPATAVAPAPAAPGKRKKRRQARGQAMVSGTLSADSGTPLPRWGPPPGHPPSASTPAHGVALPGGHVAPALAGAPKLSVLAVIGFILAFACGPVGLVLSLIAFALIKRSKGRQRGEWLAVAGVIVAAVLIMAMWASTQQKPRHPKRGRAPVTAPRR